MRTLIRHLFLALSVCLVAWNAAGQRAAELSPSDFVLTSPDIGMGRFSSERWGLLRATIRNRTPEARQYLVLVPPPGDQAVTTARQVTVPAGAVRRAWVPFHPGTIAANRRDMELSGVAVELTGGVETIVATRPMFISTRPDPHRSIYISDVRDMDDSAWNLLLAMRLGRELPRTVSSMSPRRFPDTVLGIDAADSVLLASEERLTPTQAAVLRRWLADGGTLWVMLDAVDAGVPLELLGDAWTVSEVDRFDLTQVALVDDEANELESRSFEDPVRMVRVLPGRMRVHQTIRGWPAVMSTSVGRGRLIVTTMEARGWLDAGTKVEDDIKLTPALEALGGLVLVSRPDAPKAVDAFEPIVTGQIGYRVAGRAMVATVLMAVAVVILVVGMVLSRGRRLEWIGWVSVTASMAAAAILVVVGLASRRAVPPMLSYGQQVQVVPELNLALTRGVAHIYSPTIDRTPIPFESSVLAMPRLNNDAGVRMVWHGSDRYAWQGLPIPSGDTRQFTTTGCEVLASAAPATMRLRPAGIELMVPQGPLADLQDRLFVSGRSAWPIASSASGAAMLDAEPARGQYIGGATLSDRQRRRQALYASLVESADFDTPMLLGWASELAPDVQHPNIQETVGDSLVMRPVRLLRPEPGETFTVPGQLVIGQPYRRSPDGRLVTLPLYDARAGAWLESQQQLLQPTVLRFTLPPELLPVEVTGATLQIDMRATGFTVEVGRLNADRTRILQPQRFENPATPITIRFDSLDVSPDGQLDIGLRVLAAPDAGMLSKWRVERMSLTVEARIAAAGDTHEQ